MIHELVLIILFYYYILLYYYIMYYITFNIECYCDYLKRYSYKIL